jgi:spore germination protein GerM
MRTPTRRTATRPSGRATHRQSLVAMMITGLLLAAYTNTGTEPPDATTPDVPAPATPPAPAPDTDDDADETVVVAAFLVRSAPTEFYVEPVPIRTPDVGDDVSARISAAIEALLALELPEDPELFTSVPSGTILRSVAVDGSIATLDLGGGIVGSSGASAQERTFAQQLAHTARVDTSITAIRLTVDGAPIDELWGHLDWSVPVEADPFALSPVTVTTPLAGETLPPGEITFRGQATVFEATVVVTLLAENGAVVEEGFVTATTGAPDRGTWEWTVTLPGAGLYTIVAEETDPSDGEGRPPFVTTRTFRAAG